MDLSRQGASFDMHHDLFRSIRDLDLRSNFNLTFQGHITRLSDHNTTVGNFMGYPTLFWLLSTYHSSRSIIVQ